MSAKLVVLTGRDYEDKHTNAKKTAWTRIGAAWRTDSGAIQVRLDALPVDGTMLIKEDEPRDKGGRR